MEASGRLLILMGGVIVLFGLVMTFGDRLPFRLGRLPLDLRIERGNFTLYLPIGTSILLSVLLTLIVSFLGRRG